MTDSTSPTGSSTPPAADDSSAPEYTQLGEEGNPLSGDHSQGAGIDAVPNAAADDDSAENPPLPDWGPTDGTHGVDGADQNS